MPQRVKFAALLSDARSSPETPASAPLRNLFYFAESIDVLLLLIAAAASAAAGACIPLAIFLLSRAFDSAASSQSGGFDPTPMQFNALGQIVAAAHIAAFTLISTACTQIAQHRQMARFRKAHLRALLRQEPAWHDSHNPFELPVREAELLSRIQRGLSAETMLVFENVGCAGAGIGFGLYNQWDTALVVLATTPLLALSFFLLRWVREASSVRISDAYCAAGAVGSEALQSIRTIASFGLERMTTRRYDGHLLSAETVGVKQAWLDGLSISFALTSANLCIAVGFIYAALAMARERENSSFPYEVQVSAANLLRDAGLGALADRLPDQAVKLAYCAFDCGDPYAMTNLDLRSMAGLRGPNGQPPARLFYQLASCANASRPLVPFLVTCSTASLIHGNMNMLRLFSRSSPAAFEQTVDDGGSSLACGYTIGNVVVALISVYIAVSQFNMAIQNMDQISVAVKATVPILRTINRHVPIDPLSTDGATLTHVKGAIELRGVKFAYPTAPERLVCTGYSLEIGAGEMVALCGPSGGGKSTIIALIERFYDPLQGAVLLDGVDLRSLNVRWLRQQLGLVGQEPVLFSGSVAENIAYGCEGASMADVEAAARASNAHGFVSAMPGGYDAPVGTGGSKLSGGQKQRIAIARAIVRRPAVLLLDEATSALDSASERVVQAALDEIMAAEQRTTVAIAHRLSTIRHADKIAVVDGGRVVEQGTYDELLGVEGGHFHALAHKLETRSGDGSSVRTSRASGVVTSSEELGDERNSVASVDAPLLLEQPPADAKPGRASRPARWVKLDLARRLFELQGGGDRALMSLGCAASVVEGLVPAVCSYWIMRMLVALAEESPDSIRQMSLGAGLALSIVAAAQLTSGTVSFGTFKTAGHHLTRTLRSRAMASFLRQPPCFFDEEGRSAVELALFLSDNVGRAQSLTCEKARLALQQLSTLVACVYVILRFGYWQLALVLFACVPLLAVAMALQKVLRGIGTASPKNTTGDAGAVVVAEALSAMHTVAAFGLESQLAARVARDVDVAATKGMVRTRLVALGAGFSRLVPNSTMGAALFYGSILIKEDADLLSAEVRNFLTSGAGGVGEFVEHDPQTGCVHLHSDLLLQRLVTPMIVTMFMALSMGTVTQLATQTAAAAEAAALVLGCLDRVSPIDPLSDQGATLPHVKGAIKVRDVVFAYPSAPERLVCKGYSLEIGAGQMVALCGPSGGGKSTIIALIERFYDPMQGAVLLDGVDLRSLNVRWLRQQLGLVGQEPVLFSGSVAENIAYGCEGASMADVEAAARASNAHGFVSAMPGGYDAPVGTGGSKLSGGQKQRIAIARAIVRRPAVLLLDEATSALDSASERVVQAALDEIMAAEQRTTVAIAHRLSTIRHADKIAVVDGGRVVEQGTYDELLALDRTFASLVAVQHA